MISTQTFVSVPTFGGAATIQAPAAGTYSAGYLPGQVYPAEHQNYFMHGLTANGNTEQSAINSVIVEINNVLAAASITPNAGVTNQLELAIEARINTLAVTPLNTHIANTQATAPGIHGATSSSTINTLVARDATGGTTLANLGIGGIASSYLLDVINASNNSLARVKTSAGGFSSGLVMETSTGALGVVRFDGTSAILEVGYGSANVSINAGGTVIKNPVQILTAGAGSTFILGSNATGKTNLQITTSADASGFVLMQATSATGSVYGNILVNPSGGNLIIGVSTDAGTAYTLQNYGYAKFRNSGYSGSPGDIDGEITPVANNYLALGTKSNHTVGIIANNSTRVFVFGNGNVKIGSGADESSLLQVGDSAATSNSAIDVKVIGRRGTTDGIISRVLLKNSTDTGGAYASIYASRVTADNNVKLTFSTMNGGVETVAFVLDKDGTFTTPYLSTIPGNGDLQQSAGASFYSGQNVYVANQLHVSGLSALVSATMAYGHRGTLYTAPTYAQLALMVPNTNDIALCTIYKAGDLNQRYIYATIIRSGASQIDIWSRSGISITLIPGDTATGYSVWV